MKTVLKSVLLLSAVALSSCGGGGGGGGGSSSHGVRILHAGIDLAPADMTSSAAPGVVLSSAAFGAQSSYVEVPDGQQVLTLTVRSGTGAVSTSATVTGDEKYSLLLFEGNRGSSFSVSLISDIVPELDNTQSAIRVVHGVHLAGGLDIAINGTPITGGAVPAQGSAYQIVAAGPVSITAKSNGSEIYSGTVTLGPRGAYTLLLTGETGYFIGGRLLQDD